MQRPNQKCTACRADAAKMTNIEVASYLNQLDDWEMIVENDVQKLRKLFLFKSYVESLAFINAIARAANEEGHHPLMISEYKQVTVLWWTHVIGGLHANDFIMAAECDELYKGLS